MTNHSKDIFKIEAKYSKIYHKIKMQHLFDKYPVGNDGLIFGYICPGAMKTLEYLNKSDGNKKDKLLVDKIKKLTDLQFFIEIIVIYGKYVKDRELYLKLNKELSKNGCQLSKIITKNISTFFSELSTKISKNIPDDFYHIRHNTLICSNNKKLALERIELLKSMYKNKKENFSNMNKCLGRRDGVSGCRDCCQEFKSNYGQCVRNCMNY